MEKCSYSTCARLDLGPARLVILHPKLLEGILVVLLHVCYGHVLALSGACVGHTINALSVCPFGSGSALTRSCAGCCIEPSASGAFGAQPVIWSTNTLRPWSTIGFVFHMRRHWQRHQTHLMKQEL